MLSAIIWYLFFGVAYNFFWDLLTTRVGSNENRFTMMERLIVLTIWPLVTVFFFGMLLKNLFSNKD
jgi:hypothetical protein